VRERAGLFGVLFLSNVNINKQCCFVKNWLRLDKLMSGDCDSKREDVAATTDETATLSGCRCCRADVWRVHEDDTVAQTKAMQVEDCRMQSQATKRRCRPGPTRERNAPCGFGWMSGPALAPSGFERG
jgi:hypothetical protein